MLGKNNVSIMCPLLHFLNPILLVSTNESAQRHNPEQQHCHPRRENLKSR
jgi:hypothetical protein